MLYARCQAGAERPAGSGQLMREAGRNENLYACQRCYLSACVRERVGESLGVQYYPRKKGTSLAIFGQKEDS